MDYSDSLFEMFYLPNEIAILKQTYNINTLTMMMQRFYSTHRYQ